jgi:hypothetical protein
VPMCAAALTACGGSQKSTATTFAAGGAGASSSTPSNAQDTARVKLTQCVREKTGVNLPETQGHSAIGQLSPADRQKVSAALQGPCRQYRSQAFGNAANPQSQGFLDALTSFTACLRKHGVKVPDPDPSSPFAVLHSLDQSDPRVAAASTACRAKLAPLNGG